jgi:integrase/recombinase XerC
VPLVWQREVEAWRASMRVAGMSEATVYTRTHQVRSLGCDMQPLGPFDVTTAELVNWIACHRWSQATRLSVRSGLRMFYAWAVKAGRTSYDPAAGLPKVRKPPPRPRPASEGAYRFALAVAGPRERLMLRLAAEMGLRRAEVACVHSRDLVQHVGGAWSLVVHGKGGRERLVPVPAGLLAELRSLPPGYVFPSPIRGHGHLSRYQVGRVLRALLPAGVTPHMLRHRFSTLAYAVDHDLLAVQELLGHASPATTRHYVEVPDADRRRLVQLVSDAAEVKQDLVPDLGPI